MTTLDKVRAMSGDTTTEELKQVGDTTTEELKQVAEQLRRWHPGLGLVEAAREEIRIAKTLDPIGDTARAGALLGI